MTFETAPDVAELTHAVDPIAANLLETTDASELELELTMRLYRGHYCRPSRVGAMLGFPPARDFVASLSAANTGVGTLESGWTLLERRDDICVVTKHGVVFWAAPSQISEAHGQLRVAVSKEMHSFIPGFYYFVGNAIDDSLTDESSITRFYFHIREAGAAALVTALSTRLNEAKVPFSAKILRQPGAFLRADAAVLYLKRRFVEQAIPHIRTIYASVRRFMRAPTPMFALRLAPGLAMADDPGQHRVSFGQHRCSMIARGLLAAFREGANSREARLAHVLHAFDAERISPKHTHLRDLDTEPYPDFTIEE